MAYWYLDNTITDAQESDSYNGGYGVGKLRNSWTDVGTLQVGDTWALKAGTTWTNSFDMSMSNPSGETQRVTLRSYGDGPRPIIDVGRRAAYCVRIQNKQYVTIRDLELRNGTNANLQILNNSTRACSHTKIKNVVSRNAGTDGISNVQAVNSSGMAPSPTLGLVIEDCEAYDCGQHGIAVVASAVGAIIRNCKAKSCSPSSSGWGIYMGGFASSFTSGWTQTAAGGNNYKRDLGHANLNVTNVLSGQSEAAYKLTFVAFVSDSTALNDGEWTIDTTNIAGATGCVLYINIGNNPNTATSVSVVYQECVNGLIDNCEAWDMSSAYDGVGIGLDRGSNTCSVINSRSFDNPGDGFQSAQAIAPKFSGNVSSNNKGYGIHNATSTGAVYVTNNTLINNSTGALGFSRQNSGSSATGLNNICYGGNIGVYVTTMGGTNNINYNNVYGNGTAYSGISAGANDITTNPFLSMTPGLVPTSSSSLLTSGTYVANSRLQGGKRLTATKPVIGAFDNV